MKIILKRPLWFTAITTLCFIVITLFAATGCDKLKNPGYFGDIIDVKVENASKYSNVVEVVLRGWDSSIGYIEIARGKWNGDGFTIVLPKTLNPDYLHALVNYGWYPTIIDPPSTMTISNKNVKILNADFRGIDKDGNVVTRFFAFEIDKDDNPNSVIYTYVESEVTIAGYAEREGELYTEYNEEMFRGMHVHFVWLDKITTTYSVEWKEGWNIWSISRFGNYKKTPTTATEKWSTTPISRLKWYGSEDLRELLMN